MSGPVFVLDAQGTALMPMAAAYARKLLQSGKARRQAHHAFSVIRLNRDIAEPLLRPVLLTVTVHLHTAELVLVADGTPEPYPLLRIWVDLTTAMPWKLRRRAAHRRRRRRRGRYRAPRRQGVPSKLRRPSLHRSVWGSRLRQRMNIGSRHGPPYISPTLRWRAQAIERSIAALQRLVPISHVLLMEPAPQLLRFSALSPAERRRQLIDIYGRSLSNGQRVARCMYCLAEEADSTQIEVDHRLPRSRGGTEAWENLVLACTACNRRKGDQTVAEAGMTLQVRPVPQPVALRREPSYVRWTLRLLREQLRSSTVRVLSISPDSQSPEDEQSVVGRVLRAILRDGSRLPQYVAKPIGRPTGQIYAARDYPLNTPLRPGYERIGNAIKRRLRVNAGLALIETDGQTRVQVVRADEQIPPTASHFVTVGMLVAAERAGQSVSGIVTAIQSAGKISIAALRSAGSGGIGWQRIVVSPQKHLRILSTQRVIFLGLPDIDTS
jgi:5-methylcytosine-specific restriction endonuclease McrA